MHRMRLVGGQKLNPIDGDYGLISSVFRRLPKEANHTGGFIGYDSFTRGGDHLSFFGIEVDEIVTDNREDTMVFYPPKLLWYRG